MGLLEVEELVPVDAGVPWGVAERKGGECRRQSL